MTTRPKMLELQPSVGASAQAWAARINACWRASFEGILEAGRLLKAAKDALAHGEFQKMLDTELQFRPRTAQRLMAIAADERITNATHASHLPTAWTTLYELTTLNDEQFETGIKTGKINPDMERKDVPKGSRSIMGSRQEPDDSLDFFPTPPWATRALMEVVLSGPFDSIWEPACGYGHMSEVLLEYCARVYATDIFDYAGFPDDVADFLHGDVGETFDWIITNPPFGDNTEKFVLAALDRAQIGVAMFVRLQWLESVGRYETIFRDHPPTCIAFFAERVPLCKGEWKPDGTTATAYIWLVWMKGQEPRPPLWIPPGQRERLTKADDAERFTVHPVIRKGERITDDSGTNHQPESVHDSVDTDARPPATASVSEPASVETSAPHMADAGSPSFSESDLPEIILPGKWATFEHVAGFIDLTSEVAGRAS